MRARLVGAAALVLLCLATTAAADITISGPDKCQEYKQAKIKVNGVPDKAAVIWRWDKKSLDGGKVSPDGQTVWLTGPPGTYTIEAMSIKLDKDGQTIVDEAEFTLVIEGKTPPKPPDPPVPPTPTDQLTKDLQALYGVDPATDKATNKTKLAALYRQAVLFADRTELKTVGDLHDLLETTRKATVPDTALVPLRTRIKTDLEAALGTSASTALSDSKRSDAKTVFARIATALDGVK